MAFHPNAVLTSSVTLKATSLCSLLEVFRYCIKNGVLVNTNQASK